MIAVNKRQVDSGDVEIKDAVIFGRQILTGADRMNGIFDLRVEEKLSVVSRQSSVSVSLTDN
jgi:hypothetical protein